MSSIVFGGVVLPDISLRATCPSRRVNQSGELSTAVVLSLDTEGVQELNAGAYLAESWVQ